MVAGRKKDPLGQMINPVGAGGKSLWGQAGSPMEACGSPMVGAG